MAFADSNPSSVELSAEPSVHPQETTEHNPLATSYRSRLLEPVREEFEATRGVYAKLDRRDGKYRTWNLDGCRTDAHFAVSKRERTVTVLTNSCRLRWCPLCSKSRAKFVGESVCSWVKLHPRPKLLTLTLAHSSDSLDSQITRLYACFRELRRRRFVRDAIRGGIWFFQVKKTQSTNQWHPHVHVLLDSEYMAHGVLKQLWSNITGDSHIIDIRVIRNPKVASEYVSRYSARPAKLSELSPDERMELVESLHSRRLCGKFGTASEVDLSGKSNHTSSDYHTIISWSKARDSFLKLPVLRLLYQCYKTGEPLPDEVKIEKLVSQFNPPPFTLGVISSPLEPDPYLFDP